MGNGRTMLAIIGGSTFTQLTSLNVVRRQVVRTPHGEQIGRAHV